MSATTVTPPVSTTTEPPKTEEKPKLPVPTAEELAAAQKAFLDRQFPVGKSLAEVLIKEKAELDAVAKEEEAEPVPPPPVEPPKEPEAKVETELPKVEEKPKAPVTLPPATPEIPKGTVEPKEPAPKQPETWTDVEQESLRVFEKMGVRERVEASWKREAAYTEAWQKANPGKAFDDNAEEHEAFYATNDVPYDEATYNANWRKMIKEEILEASDRRTTKIVEDRTGKQDASQKLASDEPEFARNASDAILIMVKEANPDFAKLMQDGDTLKIDKAVADKMQETDPLAADILREEAKELQLKVVECGRLLRHPDVYQLRTNWAVPGPDGRKIFPHQEIGELLLEHESRELAKPPEETMQGGKRLLSHDVMAETLKEINQNKTLSDDQRNRALNNLNASYRTLGEDDYRAALVEQSVEKSKKRIEKMRKYVTPAKAKPAETAPVQPPTDAPVASHKHVESPTRPKPPAVESPSGVTDIRRNAAVTQKEIHDSILKAAFG